MSDREREHAAADRRPANRGARRRSLPALLLLLALATATVLPLGPAPAAAQVEPRPAPATAQANPGLAEQLALAKRDEPYLMLETSLPRLRLMRGAAVLREFTVLRVEVGTPAVLFVRRPAAAIPWQRARSLVALDPPRFLQRTEVIAPPLAATQEEEPSIPPDEEPVIPPDPAEAQPAPPRYFLRLEDGFAVEVHGGEPDARDWRSRLARLGWRIQDILEAAWPGHAARLRVVMPEAEAGALYRALPEAMSFLVV